jgi:hypothetical protein
MCWTGDTLFAVRLALICGEAAGARLLQALACSAHEVVAVLASGPAQAVAARLGHRPQPLARVRALTGQACDVAPGTVRREGSSTLVACADEWLQLRR